MKSFVEVRDKLSPVYDGTTCSSTRVNAWNEGYDAAIAHDPRVKALREALDTIRCYDDFHKSGVIASQALAAWEEK